MLEIKGRGRKVVVEPRNRIYSWEKKEFKCQSCGRKYILEVKDAPFVLGIPRISNKQYHDFGFWHGANNYDSWDLTTTWYFICPNCHGNVIIGEETREEKHYFPQD